MEWWWERQLADEGLEVVIHEQGRIVSRPQLVIHRDTAWADRLAAVNPPRRTAAHAVLDVVAACRALDQAAHSSLELRYLRDVERRHRLSTASTRMCITTATD